MISEEKTSEILNQFLDENINGIVNVAGVDLIYFLDDNYQIVKEQNITDSPNYLEQIQNIIKSACLNESFGFYLKPFHTCTLLNENGLIIISKLTLSENLYMVIIAGENEPVDLINLMKTCKEVRVKYEDFLTGGR